MLVVMVRVSVKLAELPGSRCSVYHSLSLPNQSQQMSPVLLPGFCLQFFLATVVKRLVWSRPAGSGRCHEKTFVLNWRCSNKD